VGGYLSLCHDQLVPEAGKDAVTVLIADDQEHFREAARAVVGATAGFEVVGEANSGRLAIEKVDSLAPDLVLMDIKMDGMDGIQAATRITERSPRTVTFLVSTYRATDLPADARSSGAAAYIHKEQFGPQLLSELWASRGDGRLRVIPPEETAHA
jgi:two-component system invasion response regulator UvrY